MLDCGRLPDTTLAPTTFADDESLLSRTFKNAAHRVERHVDRPVERADGLDVGRQ